MGRPKTGKEWKVSVSVKFEPELAREIDALAGANFSYRTRILEEIVNLGLKELKKDNLTTVDVLNILSSEDARIEHDAELEKGSYRYRIGTKKIMVVVAFDSILSLVIVTAWRIKI